VPLERILEITEERSERLAPLRRAARVALERILKKEARSHHAEHVFNMTWRLNANQKESRFP